MTSEHTLNEFMSEYTGEQSKRADMIMQKYTVLSKEYQSQAKNFKEKHAEVEQAENQLESDRAKYEAALPPERRLTALRKRLRAAEASAAKFATRVDSIQLEIDEASDRLHEAKLGLRAQKTRVSSIQADIEATELQVPPVVVGDPKKPGLVPPSRPPLQLDELYETVCEHFCLLPAT